MFRKEREYRENKERREKEHYASLTPTQKRICEYIRFARLELNGEFVTMRSDGLSIDCYLDASRLKVGVTTAMIEKEIRGKLADEGLPCPPIHVHYM